MKISHLYYTKWIEILRKSKIPSGYQSTLDELISVLNNPLYQFMYWERPLVPDIRNKDRKWPVRWMPFVNTWKFFEPTWFLVEAHPHFGFAFKWNNNSFDVYGDVTIEEPTHPLLASRTTVTAELDFSRLNKFASSTEEPTNKYYFHADRQHWGELLNKITPPKEYQRGFDLLKALVQSNFAHLVPWIKPPQYNTSLNAWEGNTDIVLNPSPFIVVGSDLTGNDITGLAYWWEQKHIKVYGGIYDRKKQPLRLIDPVRISRIAVMNITPIQQFLGREPTLTPSKLLSLNTKLIP